ncbi:DUF4011 domain-containing protein [Faecalicatena sp. BF-R-105]|nr:DUF4011 domain-containing protein [Faecalicatena sp. BF-R-105]
MLAKEITCPVCGSVYHACSTAQTREWSAAFGRYNLNGNAYNSAVRDNYARQQEQNRTNQQAKIIPIIRWKDQFALSTLKRGEAYARKGVVLGLAKSSGTFSAKVQGEDIYQVNISIKDQGITSMECACPLGKAGDLCKHMAAVLFVAVDGVQKEIPDSLPAKQAPQKTNAKAEAGAALASVIQQYLASTPTAKTLEAPTAKVEATPVSNPMLNTPSVAPTFQSTEPSNVSGYAEAASLERKIGRWKRELLDTGKRNKMINYRETSRSTLKILEPGLEELFNKLAISEKELTFQKPINKDTDYRTYAFLSLLETLSYSLPVHVGDIKASGTIVEREKTLKNLRSKTKLAREEQGTNILYLSFGFILWRETDRPSAVWMKAPLLMMPVSLELKSMNAPYTISRYEDDIEVNPTLDYLLNSEYGIDLPTFELKDKKSITDYLDTIEEIVNRRGWKLVREVSLGLLSFQKINMYHDLNNDYNHDLIMRHPVLRSMGGDYSAIKGLPPELQNYDFDKVDPQDTYQVVNADSSQQEAILLSKRGVSFVMQGPPGTGKSQTITNIISEALADGKKILFVSEKAAALQVVLKRLTEVGLADFCLSLHDYKANKKEIIDNIGANLSLTEQRLPRNAVSDLTELMHNREALNEYATELHRSVAPLNTSIYSAFGRITQLESASAVEFQVQDPLTVSEATFSEMLYSVEMYERALHAMGLLHENPWYMTTAKSSGQAFKQQIESQTKNLPTKLPAIETKIRALNSSWQLQVPETMAGTQDGIEEIKQVVALPLFPIKWMDEDVRKKLLETARTEKAAQTEHHDRIEKFEKHYLSEAQIAKMHQEHLNKVLVQLRMSWSDAALALNAEEIRAKYASAYATTDKPIAECIRETAKASSEVKTLAEKTLACFVDAKEILSLAQIDAFANLYFCAKLISILVDAPYMETEWFDLRTNADVLPLLEDACKRCEMLESKTARLLENWEPGILSIAADDMLARFKTEYSGLFYKLKGSYKEDIKTLKLLAKQVGVQITDEVAIAVLQAVKEIDNEKAWFEGNSEQLTAVFKSQFKGANTDWDKLRYGVTSAKKIAEMFPYANIPADVIAAIQTAILSTQKSAEIRRLSDELSEEKVAELGNAIQMLSYIEMSKDDISISGTYIAQIDAFLADCTNQEEQLYTVLDCYKGDKATVTYQNLASMLDLVAAVCKERGWFDENRVTLESLYADRYTGESTDWDAICGTMSIGQAATVREWMSEFSAKEPGLVQMFADRYTGIETDWQSIVDDLECVVTWVENRKPIGALTDGFVEMICDNSEQHTAVKTQIEQIQNILNEINPELNAFIRLFQNGEEYKNILFSEIVAKYTRCMNSFDQLDKWIDYTETNAECDKLGLASFTEAIAKADNTVADVKDAFEKGFYAQWIIPALNSAPALQSFRKRVHEQYLEKFTDLDESQFGIARSRIRNKIIKTFPDQYSATGPRSEIGILKHEMEKKRRIMPLRKLFRTIPNLLLTLKPCVMMSPLSVAYFLEADSYHFDMVIFDEASQIFPQDAIGAIFRADQVIIAGDTKQLPPTDFFSTNTANGTEDYDVDEDGEWDTEIYDSILEETANILPNRTLRWHYRSRNEHLIAFSNQEIYQNDLVTFPSIKEKEDDGGVEFVYVEEGYYEPTPKNYNILEAKRCVELVVEHIEKHPDRSLGIIAFSEKQQQAIAREIQLFREKNPKYEDFFMEGKEEEFFIKNLENVQGDERDTIFFSIGYAKTKAQKLAGKSMTLRFGPLGKQGGERRLNVAITRAKRNVKLVSSILPSDIDLSRTESEGIRLLHDYIAFAMNDSMALASSQARVAQDEFKYSIADYIRSKGYTVCESIGCSGYKIDIAIKHASQREEYVAGIECDGLSYVSARTARDRDRLRKSVLASMGWRLYRVWSTEWYKNPEIEGQKLIAFIEAAIAEVDERIRREEEEKRLEEERKKAQLEKERKAKEQAEKERQMQEQRCQAEEERRAEAARRAEAERKAKLTREREERRLKEERAKQETERRRLEEAKRAQAEKASQSAKVYTWAVPGVRVQHKSFGIGIIKAIRGTALDVEFNGDLKHFSYPGAFEQKFLTQVIETAEATSPVSFQEKIKQELAGYGIKYTYNSDSYGFVEYAVEHLKTVRNVCSKYGAKSFNSFVQGGIMLYRIHFAPGQESAPTAQKNDIYKRLVNAGFRCIDNRSTSSILWVLYSVERKLEFEKIARECNVKYTLERRGSVATKNLAAWRIMC